MEDSWSSCGQFQVIRWKIPQARMHLPSSNPRWALAIGKPHSLEFVQGGAPQVISWFIIPLTIDISPTKTIVIGVICTNLAIQGAPPCRISNSIIPEGLSQASAEFSKGEHALPGQTPSSGRGLLVGAWGCGDGKQRVGVWKTSLLRLLDLSEKTYSGWFYTYIAYSLTVLDYFLVDSAQIIGQCSFFIPASQGDESAAATWKTDVWSAAKPPSWAVTKMARWQRDGMCFQQSDLCDYNYTTHIYIVNSGIFFEHYFMILCVWL